MPPVRLLLIALLAAAAAPALAQQPVTGSGRIVDEARPLAGFTALRVGGGVRVELRANDRERVTVRADDNLLPLVETRVDGTALVIGVAHGASFRARRVPRVYVGFVRLDDISVTDSGHVHADRVRGDTFAVSLAGSGDVRIDALDVNALGAMLAGSGDFIARGRADQQGYRIRGAGDVRARELVGRNVTVSIAGSGDAVVHATETLAVSISGAGDVVYRGDPKITKSIVGSGSVRPAR